MRSIYIVVYIASARRESKIITLSLSGALSLPPSRAKFHALNPPFLLGNLRRHSIIFLRCRGSHTDCFIYTVRSLFFLYPFIGHYTSRLCAFFYTLLILIYKTTARHFLRRVFHIIITLKMPQCEWRTICVEIIDTFAIYTTKPSIVFFVVRIYIKIFYASICAITLKAIYNKLYLCHASKRRKRPICSHKPFYHPVRPKPKKTVCTESKVTCRCGSSRHMTYIYTRVVRARIAHSPRATRSWHCECIADQKKRKRGAQLSALCQPRWPRSYSSREPQNATKKAFCVLGNFHGELLYKIANCKPNQLIARAVADSSSLGGFKWATLVSCAQCNKSARSPSRAKIIILIRIIIVRRAQKERKLYANIRADTQLNFTVE